LISQKYLAVSVKAAECWLGLSKNVFLIKFNNMEIYSIIVAALVIILFFIFIRTKTKTGGISQEVLDQLNISKAKAEERADNLKA
jgi:hypothetical protein